MEIKIRDYDDSDQYHYITISNHNDEVVKIEGDNLIGALRIPRKELETALKALELSR